MSPTVVPSACSVVVENKGVDDTLVFVNVGVERVDLVVPNPTLGLTKHDNSSAVTENFISLLQTAIPGSVIMNDIPLQVRRCCCVACVGCTGRVVRTLVSSSLARTSDCHVGARRKRGALSFSFPSVVYKWIHL